MAAFIPMKVNAERFKSFKALFFGGHPFWHIQRKYGKRTKENMSSDHNCYNFLQESPMNSIPSLDCCHFIVDSGNAHNDHLAILSKRGHMVSIRISLETAIKMQHSGEGIELIQPSYKK